MNEYTDPIERFGDAEARYERDREAEWLEARDVLRRERLAEHAPTDFKPPARIIEDQLGWEQLRRAKLAPCRVCGDSWLPQLHHLVSRSLLGDDVPDNLVPLCSACHQLVEEHDPQVCLRLGIRLTDREAAYVVATKGAAYLERRYRLKVAA